MSIPEIVEYTYTSENPETGSKPPEHFAWVMFEHGTIFLTFPNENTPQDATPTLLAEVALQELKALGYPMGGTPSGDFNVSRLPWFADSYTYTITYNSGHIFNVQEYEEETQDIMVGLLGRALRGQDAENPKVVLVRDFTGKQTVMK